MANNLSVNIGISGNVNGISLNQNSNTQTVPTGSVAFEYSVFINTGSWQNVFTGSSGQQIGTIGLFNSNTTGSISISTSATGTPVLLSANAGAGAIQTNYNLALTALYAQSFTAPGFGTIIVVSN